MTFNKASVTLSAKPDKNIPREQQTDNIPMNVDVNFLKKILANQAQHIKNIIYMPKWGLPQEGKGGNVRKAVTITHHINRQKAYFYLDRAEKAVEQNATLFHHGKIKKKKKNKARRELL